ncbi:hypothetical protein D8674_029694 [Pyrus ussuriensis x Pyrus communis]|uniref:Uncharacterized protein n=1 Tax=Pyrus ussuriensis x Pyrus communis TaxID=2448454 RepID=A0A5N5I2T0_9ROSA|nr:hypothetical protein D8674_029694 [Pyrus ussuriensis x Pyrus communis]
MQEMIIKKCKKWSSRMQGQRLTLTTRTKQIIIPTMFQDDLTVPCGNPGGKTDVAFCLVTPPLLPRLD